HEDRALEDDGEYPLERGVVEVLEREALADPGVIHDDVEPSELGERARHRRLHRRPVGDIGRDREAAPCQGFDAGARLEGRLEVGATPLQLSVMSAAGGACLLLSLAWARALGGRPPLPYLVWPSFVARGLFLLAPLASSAWSLVSLVVAANVFGAAAGPAQAAVVERLYPRAARG